MTELYDIPKRLKRKNGLFGTIKPLDLGIAIGLIVVGAIFLIAMQNLVGIFIVLVFGGIAYFGFIFKDNYDENFREKFARQLEYIKSQKIYYYYRGTK